MHLLKIGTALLGISAALAPILAVAGDAYRYSNLAVGFAVEKPQTWYFLTAQSIVENRERMRLRDDELAEQVRQRARLPLVAISKYEDPEARPDVTPTVQIVLSLLGTQQNLSAAKLLEVVVAQLRSGLSDFRVVAPIRATAVSGLGAAHMVATYTIGNQAGGSFEVRTRVWIIPRGEVAFIIGMAGQAEGSDVAEEEFSAILQSIRIEP